MGNTKFARSRDGSRIAYDICGTGPVLILLHGGMQSRAVWHQCGYVEPLSKRFAVVTVDLRGHGESDKPAGTSNHGTDRHCEDVLAVADALGATTFALWGYSFGGNVGRYLAAESPRVLRFVMASAAFGPAAIGPFRQTLLALQARWSPIFLAEANGTLYPASLTSQEHAYLTSRRAHIDLSWLLALLEWRDVAPSAMRCPTLWLLGTEDVEIAKEAARWQPDLPGTPVTLEFLAGLDHEHGLTRSDAMLAHTEAFLEGLKH